ncbi:MAG: DNA-directed RNA polymerase subunit beta' [Candidatus Entotheonella factor]|uniref:DNA-directed RNA polymerase subunit beta' n=1 Tax=Entotheonella factor TaxID=1429438 RepID=W4LT82_ENTF1|nr:MAG: DNA-directed RNA polymerase subunit beta' [Candidatus Entotheonella factor]
MDSIFNLFEKPKDPTSFEAIRIRIASPEKIRSWSHGEVKKPETINYRTFKPERDGLFCAKIFGPVKDWECNCGKYKRMKHRGVVCERCGVEVIQSKVRRERLGHIELACPVSHVWFFKGVPSRIGILLDMSLRELERILYFENYVVIDPGQTGLKEKELLTEERYRECVKESGPGSFDAGMGAEAIRELLRRIELEELANELRVEMRESFSLQKRKKIVKRLKVVDSFRKSGNRPEWMVLEVIPVIPPELRPLVPLDGGRFATSDLNDLYRRVINRNNRLIRLQELRAPDIIIRNEKRMLQEAVDALFDNGRRGRALRGPNKRPLKSLSDMLKGKQGRFRQNLLGKRVDYSGRSVIVVSPELKLHQCGLPKKMAIELFKPFIYSKLEERGHVNTIKSAKKMVEKERPEVWDVLDEIIREYPVLLNRAPTLHRLGIQAFEPVLVEGKAIRIHPLVCTAFNADFDGDQMAVHVPLSVEAQVESKMLMLSVNNILSAAHGKPLAVPSQDIILGCYYLTKERGGAKGEGKLFASPQEARIAYDAGEVGLQARIRVRIRVRMRGEVVSTTLGRVLLSEVVPPEIDFERMNHQMDKKALTNLVAECYQRLGKEGTVNLLESLKEMGFYYATKSGLSIGINDMHIPEMKEPLVEQARQAVVEVESQYREGLITNGERYNKVIDIWAQVTEQVSNEMFKDLEQKDLEVMQGDRLEVLQDDFNSIYVMADSGARGGPQQIRQLAGMRGLMAKPSGEIMESPITANFREGLTVLQYFISTHGARKGLADTALKTANSGYLTRRLVDVAQDIIIMTPDCGTINGITATALVQSGEIIESLGERIVGRVAAEDVFDPYSGECIVPRSGMIDETVADRVESAGIERVEIRSVLTCDLDTGVCALCYGRNLSTGAMTEIGEAVGVIAAQSIGEPGTQLTMRTFHIGGTASRQVEQSTLQAKNSGTVRYHNLRTVVSRDGSIVVMNRNGTLVIQDDQGREKERYQIVYGARLRVKDEQHVERGEKLVEWDPYTLSILADVDGRVAYGDILEGVTMQEEVDEQTGLSQKVILEHYDEKRQPRVSIKDPDNATIQRYLMPAGAHISVIEGEQLSAGDIIAKIPRETTKTKDITGGLPRVAELFEARKPKEQAIISEIDGVVQFAGFQRGARKVLVTSDSGDEREYLIPRGKYVNVHEGDRVQAGEPLMDGAANPHDILDILGEKELQKYLLNEIQEVYRLQGVQINDKHIEVIVKQMLKRVVIEEPGDTDFLVGEQVAKTIFNRHNQAVMEEGGSPARGKPILLGITKSSLSTESFISAASFQETTRVLTQASVSGIVDRLRGLKENVIMGRIVPAGTGIVQHQDDITPGFTGSPVNAEASVLSTANGHNGTSGQDLVGAESSNSEAAD